MAKQKSFPTTYVIIGVALAAILISILAYLIFRSQPHDNHVCLPKDAYEKLIKPPTIINKIESPRNTELSSTDSVSDRDYRVLSDPLFPPLNRTETAVHSSLQQNIRDRNILLPTSVRETHDTYHLVGYLVNKDATIDTGGNNWKLMARMKDKNTADFYMIPANKNYDMKINITDEITEGARLRDIYTIPNQINFNSPLLNRSTYDFVEVPKGDLSYTNGGMYM